MDKYSIIQIAMQYKSLHIKNLLQAKIGNFLNKKFPPLDPGISELTGYTLEKDLTPSYTSRKNRVGIYKNKRGKRVVIKRVPYRYETVDALYLRNEAFLLSVLTDTKITQTIAPSFIDFIEKKNQIAFVTEYVEGKQVDTLDSKLPSTIVVTVLKQLKQLSDSLEKEHFYNLPVRRPFYYLISFPLNLMRVCIKNPSQIKKYMQCALLFYRNYLQVCFGQYKLGLVHRDLYPDNMLYARNTDTVSILDWESAVISDALYDLSQIAMIYTHAVGVPSMLSIIQKYLYHTPEKKRFISLAIFNSIQILTNNKTDHPIFAQTEQFLDTVTNTFLPHLLPKKTLFERVNSFTMDIINLFYALTGLPKYNKTKRIILCYHAIENSGWRFSTSQSDFQYHIDYLQKYSNIKPLDKLLQSTHGGVAITFDDGYQNVVDNALPLLEKRGIKATLFALCDSQKANRKELDNTIAIMHDQQLQLLHKKGWEIGSHTLTHANLRLISNQALENEIVASKAVLEKKLGFTIKYFAYPKGGYSKRIIEYVKKAGFTHAFTVDGFDLKQDYKDTMTYSRICIEGDMTPKQFETLLSPIGIFISRIFIYTLKLKESLTQSIKKILKQSHL